MMFNDYSKLFGDFGSALGDLGAKLDPKRIEAERRARQQYGNCVLGNKCTRGGNMCIPCAMTFTEVDKK